MHVNEVSAKKLRNLEQTQNKPALIFLTSFRFHQTFPSLITIKFSSKNCHSYLQEFSKKNFKSSFTPTKS